MPLHDSTMLKIVLAVSGDLNIAVTPDDSSLDSPRCTAAISRAEPATPAHSLGLDVKRFSACFACDSDRHIRPPMFVSACIMSQTGTVVKGFVAHVIGSWLGFKLVPNPAHCFAASVAGAVSIR